MYKFDVLAIAQVIVRVALQKYEIESIGNRKQWINKLKSKDEMYPSDKIL